jgi:hypothetical protein
MSQPRTVPESTREIVHYTWHDHTCPEGAACRSRDLHATSTYNNLPPLDAIAEAIDARDQKEPHG